MFQGWSIAVGVANCILSARVTIAALVLTGAATAASTQWAELAHVFDVDIRPLHYLAVL